MVYAADDPAANVSVWAHWRRPLSTLPYLAIDVETTGLDPRDDRVIELAAHGPAGREFTSLVDPGDARELTGPHGLSHDDLAGAPPFEEIASCVRRLLSGRILVAHNASFDLAFLRAEFARLGRPLPPVPFVCTMGLADAFALGHDSRSLAHACHRHGVALVGAHRADGDAHAAARLFELYAAHAESLGFDLGALSRYGGSTAAVESWSLPPLGTPRPSQLRPAPTALARREA